MSQQSTEGRVYVNFAPAPGVVRSTSRNWVNQYVNELGFVPPVSEPGLKLPAVSGITVDQYNNVLKWLKSQQSVAQQATGTWMNAGTLATGSKNGEPVIQVYGNDEAWWGVLSQRKPASAKWRRYYKKQQRPARRKPAEHVQRAKDHAPTVPDIFIVQITGKLLSNEKDRLEIDWYGGDPLSVNQTQTIGDWSKLKIGDWFKAVIVQQKDGQVQYSLLLDTVDPPRAMSEGALKQSYDSLPAAEIEPME